MKGERFSLFTILFYILCTPVFTLDVLCAMCYVYFRDAKALQEKMAKKNSSESQTSTAAATSNKK